jgi:hypothetical protein
LAAIITALIGIVVLGIGARAIEDASGALLMRWTWWGATLRTSSLAEFAADFESRRLVLHVLAIGVALAAGWLTAKWFRSTGPWFTVACCAAWYVALNPEVAYFVATREPLGAKHYLDLDDAFRSIGAGLCVVACALWMPRNKNEVPLDAARIDDNRERMSVGLAMLVAALAPAILSRVALDREPITNDEHAYLFQSRLFARGEIAYDAQGLADFFPARQVAESEGRLFSKYPPAHSAMLAIGERVGFPELLPRLLAMLAVALTWDLARRLRLAKPTWAAWFLALSPLWIGVESLWLSHTTTIPFCVILVWSAIVAIDKASSASALLCGFAFSVTLAARPVTAIAVALPIVVLLAIERPRRSLALLGAAIVGAAPGIVALLWINDTLTGSPFQFAYEMYAKASSPEDRFGNVTLLGAIDNTGFNLARLSTWLCGWSPALLLGLAGLVATPIVRRRWVVCAIPASLLFFYALHPFQGIPWVGPLYVSEGLPELALLSAHGLAFVRARIGARFSCCVWAASIASSVLLLHNHFAAARREIDLRQRSFAPVHEAHLEPGIVFVRYPNQWAAKRFPLLPPEPGADLVLALDLGPRNADLMRKFEKMRAWSFDPVSGQVRRLP